MIERHDNASRPPVNLQCIAKQVNAIQEYLRENVWKKKPAEVGAEGNQKPEAGAVGR